MSKNELIARLGELLKSSAVEIDGSPEAEEFDRLEAEFVARFGEWELSCAFDRLLVDLMEL